MIEFLALIVHESEHMITYRTLACRRPCCGPLSRFKVQHQLVTFCIGLRIRDDL